jgi:hypothetical protein
MKLKKIIKCVLLTTLIVLSANFLVPAQKGENPVHLGNWTVGGDPDKFYLSDVSQKSADFLRDYPEGKLIVRICSSDDFPTALIKTTLHPFFRRDTEPDSSLIPDRNFYVGRFSTCVLDYDFTYSQYWFIKKADLLVTDELYPAAEIFYEDVAQLNEFIDRLKTDIDLTGYIVHTSENERVQTNVRNAVLKAEEAGIRPERIKTLRKSVPYIDRYKRIKIRDDKNEVNPRFVLYKLQRS